MYSNEDRFRMLYEISAVNSSDTDAQLNSILHIATGLFDMQIGIVSIIEDDVYTIKNQYHPENALKAGQQFDLKSTYCDFTLSSHEVVAIDHMGQSENAGHPCYQAFEFEAYIGTKIEINKKVFGTLSFSSLSPKSKPFTEEDLRMMRIIGAWVSNILDSQQNLAALQKSEQQYRRLVEEGMTYLCVYDMVGTLLQINQPALDKLGYSQKEVVGENLKSFLIPSHAIEFEQHLQYIRDNKSLKGTFALFTKSGEVRYWAFKSTLEGDHVLGVGQDITDTIVAERALHENERSLKEAQSLAKLGSWNYNIITGHSILSDEMYPILEADPSQERFTMEDFIRLVHPEDKEKFIQLLRLAFNEHQPYTVQHRLVLPSGRTKYIYANGRPVADTYGTVVRLIGTMQDVTDQINVQQELIKAKELAEEAARVKQEFLANMSHEIRTPMNAILGFSRLLLRAGMDDEAQEYTQSIYESANTLLVVINDILDFSKIEAGKLSIEQVHFSLNKQLKLLERLFRVRVDEECVQLVFETDPALPDALVGDPVRIYQILNNLISNAIKFTDRGSVEVSTTVVEKVDDQFRVQIAVRDTGTGIAADKLETIFESFSQEKGDTTRRFGGTGLGLSIVKKLVQLMDGDIRVTSREKVGSEFAVTFLLGKGDAALIEAEVAPVDSLSLEMLEGVRILLAEDNRNNQLLAKKFLSDVGCHVDIAVDGQAAVFQIQQEPYDLVLMDIQMPIMDGLQATKAIKELGAPWCDIPIIAMTAHALKEEERRYRKEGMCEYVSKPFVPRKLYATLIKILGEHTPNVQTPRIALSLENASPEAAPPRELHVPSGEHLLIPDKVSLEHLNEYAGGDLEFATSMMAVFLEDVPTYLEQLEVSVGAEDWEAFKKAAHALKSSISFMGMNNLMGLINDIEQMDIKATEQQIVDGFYEYIRQSCEVAMEEVRENLEQ